VTVTKQRLWYAHPEKVSSCLSRQIQLPTCILLTILARINQKIAKPHMFPAQIRSFLTEFTTTKPLKLIACSIFSPSEAAKYTAPPERFYQRAIVGTLHLGVSENAVHTQNGSFNMF